MHARGGTRRVAGATVAHLETRVYRIPTDRPEADGTIAWDSTTMLLVEAVAESGAARTRLQLLCRGC